MIDTVRSFAIRWLLEPTVKKPEPEPPEPSENNIRLVVTVMDTSAFAEFEAISGGLVTSYKETNDTYGRNFEKIAYRSGKTYVTKIYDGDTYIGAYSIAKKSKTAYIVDGVEQATQEYYMNDLQDFDSEWHTETYDARTQTAHSYTDKYTITKITLYRTDIKKDLGYKFVGASVEYTASESGDNGYVNEYDNESHSDIYVFGVPSGWQRIFLDGLDYDKMIYYRKKFDENDNVLEYDFNF